MRFAPAILLTGIHLFKAATIKNYRLLTSFILILPFFLMSQSFPPDSAKVETYTRIDIGTSIGRLYSEIAFNPQESSCGTQYTREDYEHLFRMGGVGIAKVTKSERRTTTYGLNAYGGINKETNLTQNEEYTTFIGGVNPFVKYEWKWVGLGFGAHIGNLRWVPATPVEERSYDRGTRFSPVLPEAYFRLGRRDIFDLEYAMGFAFPSPYPALTYHASMGTGFGLSSEYSLRFGYFLPSTSAFMSAEGLIQKNFGFKLMYLFGGSSSDYQPYGKSPAFNLGLNYRF